MNTPFLVLLAILTALIVIGYFLGSVKIIAETEIALVERLGRYKRTLKPGIHFVIPILDTVLVETTREQILDVVPWLALTKDRVVVDVCLILYWRIVNLRRAYYEIQDIENAIQNLAIGTINYEIEKRETSSVLISKQEISNAVKESLSLSTARWGIEITDVVIQEMIPRNGSSGIQDKEKEIEAKSHQGGQQTQPEYKMRDLLQILERKTLNLRDLSNHLGLSVYDLKEPVSRLRSEGYLEIEDVVVKPDSYLLISQKGIDFLHSATS